MKKNRQLPFWIFTTSVFSALLLPNLLQDGMFMDGLLYACLSKNLSEGIGTFWYPHFSKTLHSFFYSNPPLGFGIQSIFFKLLGNTIYTERIYSFLMAATTAYLIAVLWRQIFKGNDRIKKISWLPILFWIITPVCFWSYSNNMLENTMGMFDLLAVIFIVRFIVQKPFLLYVFLSGFFIFCASLTKGFQGTFPLAALAIGWVVYRNISLKKMLVMSALLFLIPAIIYALLLQNDYIKNSLSSYLQNRVINSILHVSRDHTRLYLLFRLIQELIPSILLALIVFFIYSKKRANKDALMTNSYKTPLFFILIGLSGSLPLMITMEQSGFYLIPSLPYFCIAIAVFAAPGIVYLIEKIDLQNFYFNCFKFASVFLLAGTLLFSFFQIGKTKRDHDMIHDASLIGSVIPKGTILGSTNELWENWALQEYLIRHFYISQDNKILPGHNYLILDSENSVADGVKMEKVNIPTNVFHLYKVLK